MFITDVNYKGGGEGNWQKPPRETFECKRTVYRLILPYLRQGTAAIFTRARAPLANLLPVWMLKSRGNEYVRGIPNNEGDRLATTW